MSDQPSTEIDPVLDAAILAVVDIESREPDPSVEQYAKAVLAAVAPLLTVHAMTSAADLADTCETVSHASRVIRFTAESVRAIAARPGLHACIECGLELDADDLNSVCEECLADDGPHAEPEYVDCTCGHPNDDHNLGECPFPGCGCGVIEPLNRPGQVTP